MPCQLEKEAEIIYHSSWSVPDFWNLYSVIRQVVRDNYLEQRIVLALELILEEMRQNTVNDFDWLNLFYNRIIPLKKQSKLDQE